MYPFTVATMNASAHSTAQKPQAGDHRYARQGNGQCYACHASDSHPAPHPGTSGFPNPSTPFCKIDVKGSVGSPHLL
jgi:mono/diheme cytochrome c family protein